MSPIPHLDSALTTRNICKTLLSTSMQQQTSLRCNLFLRKLEILYFYQDVNDHTMDWINCNSCCRQPGDERERTFALTSCGHIFCDLCLAQAESRDKCGACSSHCQLIHLSSKMKPDAEMFFLEPAALLKKHYNQVNRLLEFQKDHRVRLVSFHRKVLQKYKALEKLQSSTVTHIKELEKKYVAAKNRIQELENENKKLRIMISSQGGGTGAYPVVPCSSPADLCRGTLTPKKTPPKINGSQVSPGETRISPGRLTLLKTNQGSVISSHGRSPSNMPVCTSAHAIPFASVQVARKSPVGQYRSPPEPYHYIGPHQHQHQQNHVLHVDNGLNTGTPNRPGVGYFRNPGLSPTGSVLGSMNRLALLPNNQHHVAHQSVLQAVPPSTPPFPAHTMNTVLTSPNMFSKQMQGHPISYRKYVA